VDTAAWVAGGILAATGNVARGRTVVDITEALTSAFDPPGRSVPWAPPAADDVTPPAGVLAEAWAAATGALPGAGWGEAVVRLVVWDLETLVALGPLPVMDGVRVVAHAELPARRIAWRWPIRLGVADPAAAGALRGDGIHVRALAEGGTYEVAVLDRPDPSVQASCVVLAGTAAADLDEAVLHDFRDLGAAAVVAVAASASDLSWLTTVVRHLACGRPLDVAVGLAQPAAVVLADEGFLELTGGREYARELTYQLRGADPAVTGDALVVLERLAEAPFDADGRAGAELAAVVGSLPEDLTTVERHLEAAMANGGGEGTEEDHDRGAEPPSEPAAPDAPDARRLQAQVTDPATKKVLDDRFVPGPNKLRVRIAAAVAEGAAVADAAFESPTPGRDADLTVEFIAGDHHSTQKLKLPAAGDTKWTRPVAFAVPADATDFQLVVQVWFSGRVVQSATLSGPVLAADATPTPAPAEKLRLRVDASTPPAAVHQMTPAGASFTIVPGLSGEPQLLRLAERRRVDPARLTKVIEEIGLALLAAFRAPPPSLAEAAGVLTRLAVHGRLLNAQLEADEYDAAPWVHVSTFGAADLPVELVYTHPMPDPVTGVPVCPTALAGATECTTDCPDRERSDCVCPFGFWGTSKVVERRVHTDDRTATLAGAQRTLPVLAVGAAGVSKVADQGDATATTRILAAVRSAVAAGAFHPLTTWDDLKPVAQLPARVLVLITHTIEDPSGDSLGTKLQLGTSDLALLQIGRPYVNQTTLDPGPVVLAIGCETAAIAASFADYVGLLFDAGAELVVSAISKVPGKQVADFVERFFTVLPAYLAAPGVHRFGEVLTAIRQRAVASGDVLGLAITAAGDGDVNLTAV
jgi:hypothetical protein